MVNQWGRDGQVSGGGAGAGAIITVAVISLLIGSAAGYGGARYLGLASGGRQPVSTGGDKVEVPVDPYGKTSAAFCTDIQRQLTNVSVEARRNAAENVELKSKLGSKQVAYECPSPPDNSEFIYQLRSRISQLETDLPGYEQALMKARAELGRVETERDSLKRTLDELRANASGSTSKALVEIEALRGLLKRSEFEVNRRENMLRDTELLLDEANQSRDQAKQALEVATQQKAEQVSAKEAIIARLNSEKEALTKALDDANRKLADAASSTPEEPKAPDNPKSDAKVETRDATLVENALSRAPGLKVLNASQRDTVREKLLGGACVTDALEQVFTRVPVLTLRSLIRDLDSPC